MQEIYLCPWTLQFGSFFGQIDFPSNRHPNYVPGGYFGRGTRIRCPFLNNTYPFGDRWYRQKWAPQFCFGNGRLCQNGKRQLKSNTGFVLSTLGLG